MVEVLVNVMANIGFCQVNMSSGCCLSSLPVFLSSMDV